MPPPRRNVRRASSPLLGAALVCIAAAGLLEAGASSPPTTSLTEEEQVRQLAKAPFANDLGPEAINVSGYPSEMQAKYEVFKQRCSKCHTLARPINAQFASAKVWERYVKRMMLRPGSGISGSDGKAIWEFLSYDGQARKTARRAEFEALRRRLLHEFKARYPQRYQELYAGHEDEVVKVK
ncbi:MAG: hypothetical protein HY597_05470 [Candidatus Omnitrophica bacterium]|nr:hypothetical protein [Candidatus Omnitrophota bacterium]